MTFTEASKKYKGYMAQMAMSVDNWDNLNRKADIEQELSLVLWRCLEKYKQVEDFEMDKILKTAFHNKIGHILKSKRIERMGVVSLDAKFKNSTGKSGTIGETMSKDVMTDKRYQDGINDLVANLPPESAMTVLEILNVDNRGVFVKGSRKAYGEAKSYFKKG